MYKSTIWFSFESTKTIAIPIYKKEDGLIHCYAIFIVF